MKGEAVLGVERSVSGKFWSDRSGLNDAALERQGLAISQRYGLAPMVGRLVAARDIPLEMVERYLSPTLKDELPDPSLFKDMDKAAARIADVVEAGGGIGVFADYDVDGGTSAAQFIRYLRSIDVPTFLHIPDRQDEGYGPNLPALRSLKERGAALVLCLDCGTLSIDVLGEATAEGIETIVVDHHMAAPDLPNCVAVVNPNRLDEDGAFGHLAACGVSFVTLVAVSRALRERGWFERTGRKEPALLQLLDLVALGTVCDVVPLTGLNRAFVSQGLKVQAGRQNIGMAALGDIAGLRRKPDPFAAGFMLGPRINAGGRVGRAELGARLLSTHDPDEARSLAKELDELNNERREIEAEVLAQALRLAEAQENDPIIMVAGEGWHQGVVGIVASRLKDRYARPSCVITIEEGEAKGSGRSVAGIDLGAAVIAAAQAGLLSKGGGHKMAAGFSLEAEKIEAFRDFLRERVSETLDGELPPAPLSVDAILSPGAANSGLLEDISKLEPFGTANPEPRLVLRDALLEGVGMVGEAHVRATIVGPDGAKVKAIAFRVAEDERGQQMLSNAGTRFHIAGHLRRDDYRGGNAVQFVIDDLAEAG